MLWLLVGALYACVSRYRYYYCRYVVWAIHIRALSTLNTLTQHILGLGYSGLDPEREESRTRAPKSPLVLDLG